MGVVPATEEFYKGLRRLCDANGIVLIYDEVMTGFRVALGGAQKLHGITPDLTCLGKIIGGGLPVGAFGGKKEIMSKLSPLGPVYQAGTLSGNPLAMVAGIATLKFLKFEDPYPKLEAVSRYLEGEMRKNVEQSGIPASFTRVGSMLCMFFTDKEVVDYVTATSSDTTRYGKYFHAMLDQGVYLAPAQYEAMFVSIAHSDADIEHTLEAQRKALASL
jgi:glutamate-1-semialdehyde 2,1-aminomutase